MKTKKLNQKLHKQNKKLVAKKRSSCIGISGTGVFVKEADVKLDENGEDKKKEKMKTFVTTMIKGKVRKDKKSSKTKRKECVCCYASGHSDDLQRISIQNEKNVL